MPQRKVNLSVQDMLIVNPAPRILRPWSNVKNPYPYGCSVLCNHPRDPEQKDILWKTKPDSSFLAKPNEDADDEDSPRREFLTNLHWPAQCRFQPMNSNLNPYQNSRASSAIATRSSRSLAFLLRRCVTPDAFPDNLRDRRRIVLDLRRRCRSSDGFSFTTAKTHDDDLHDAKLNPKLGQPLYELTSTEVGPGTKNRSTPLCKPRPRLAPQLSFEKEKMELQVEGVKPKFFAQSLTSKHSKTPTNASKAKAVKPRASWSTVQRVVEARRSLTPQQNHWESDTESVLSEVPLFRIEVAPKLPKEEPEGVIETKQEVQVKAETIPSTIQVNLEKYSRHEPGSAFGAFLYKSYLTIAEVAMAKHRSKNKHQNLLEPEDNFYWSSEAPKPAQIAQLSELSRLTRSKKRSKFPLCPRDPKTPAEPLPLLQGFQLHSSPPTRTINKSVSFRKPRQKRSKLVGKQATSSNGSKVQGLGSGVSYGILSVEPHEISVQKRKKKKRVTFRVKSSVRSSNVKPHATSFSLSQPIFSKPSPKSATPTTVLARASTISSTVRPAPNSAPAEPSRAQPSAKRRKNKRLSPQNSQERTLLEPKKKTVELVEDDLGIANVFREEEPLVISNPESMNAFETVEKEDFLTPEGLKKLETALRTARETALQGQKVTMIPQGEEPPMSFRGLATEEWLRIPRFGTVYGARFQLPMDMRSLEGMDSVKYLEQFVVLTRPRQRLVDLIFQRHQRNELLPKSELLTALGEVTGTEMTANQDKLLETFLDLHELESVSKGVFAGLAAVAERTSAHEETRKDDLEEADFSDLPTTLESLQINSSLHQLLLFLHRS